jgi:hypothetical protein
LAFIVSCIALGEISGGILVGVLKGLPDILDLVLSLNFIKTKEIQECFSPGQLTSPVFEEKQEN